MIFLRLFFGWLLQTAPFAVLCFQPFLKQYRFPVRKTITLTAALLCGFGAAFALWECFLYDMLPHDAQLFAKSNVIFLVLLAPCFLWYLYAVKAQWQKKLFVFAYAMAGAFLITSVNNTVCTWLILGSLQQYDGLPYERYTWVILPVLTAVFLPPLSLVLRRFCQAVEDSFTLRESVYLSLLTIFMLILMVVGVNYWAYSSLYTPVTLFPFGVLLLSIFVIYAIFLKMLGIAHEKLTAQRKYDEAQRQLTLQEVQYRQITESMESARRMRHDLRHHLVTLQGFLKSGEAERAEQYLNQTLEVSREYEITQLCGNTVVNLVAGHYQALAKEQGVSFTARIAIPNQLPIADTDLSVVIGNLLENALHAAGQEDGAFIRLNMICPGKMLAVTVDNSFNGTVRMRGGRYLSTKKDHTGYGLESVEAIAEKYSGGVEFTHEGKVFHSSVMMGTYVSAE